jgi:hypothetical protein
MGERVIAMRTFTVIHRFKSDVPPASCHGTCITVVVQTKPGHSCLYDSEAEQRIGAARRNLISG